jgi:molybdenum cofactor cytidylyltransferase
MCRCSLTSPRHLLYVVLAAGESSRMGFDKALTPINEQSPLQIVASALGRRQFVVVMPSRSAWQGRRQLPQASIRFNDEPGRGMAHSLRVGLAAVPMDCDFGVLLADMPAMTRGVLAHTERLFKRGVDVAYPVDLSGRAGHPVLFSASMRPTVQALPDGDTLWRARDAARTFGTWYCNDASAFFDLDTTEEWRTFRRA